MKYLILCFAYFMLAFTTFSKEIIIDMLNKETMVKEWYIVKMWLKLLQGTL